MSQPPVTDLGPQETYDAFYHCGSTPLENGSIIKAGNWGCIIRLYGWAHNLTFRECVFDYVRQMEFPDKSRRCSPDFEGLAVRRCHMTEPR
jgi:hypothetical protein